MVGNPQIKDMTGQQFGCLSVIEYAGKYPGTKQAARLCQCECGKQSLVCGNYLRRGLTKSCGCMRMVKAREACTTHGLTRTGIYNVWMGMRDRCHNPNNASYDRYGGRGIEVDERWFHSFEEFYKDMGPRPDGMTIERIDNNGNYEPGNCRWASRREQANNTRRNRFVETPLGRLTIAQLSRATGMTIEGLRYRMRQGQSGAALVRPKYGKRFSTC